jgi:hypothetical protein
LRRYEPLLSLIDTSYAVYIEEAVHVYAVSSYSKVASGNTIGFLLISNIAPITLSVAQSDLIFIELPNSKFISISFIDINTKKE